MQGHARAAAKVDSFRLPELIQPARNLPMVPQQCGSSHWPGIQLQTPEYLIATIT